MAIKGVGQEYNYKITVSGSAEDQQEIADLLVVLRRLVPKFMNNVGLAYSIQGPHTGKWSELVKVSDILGETDPEKLANTRPA